jgi:hypothetical protein
MQGSITRINETIEKKCLFMGGTFWFWRCSMPLAEILICGAGCYAALSILKKRSHEVHRGIEEIAEFLKKPFTLAIGVASRR